MEPLFILCLILLLSGCVISISEKRIKFIASAGFSLFIIAIDAFHAFSFPIISVLATFFLIGIIFKKSKYGEPENRFSTCTPYILSILLIGCFWAYDYSNRSDGPFSDEHLIGIRCAGRLDKQLYGSIPKFNLTHAENIVIEKLCPKTKAWELRMQDNEGPNSKRSRYIENDGCLSSLYTRCFSTYGEFHTTWNVIDHRLLAP